ncbi:MAG: hypothetical protein RBS36_00460 [Thiomicrospira sp.]|jgi:hypothetical protein|nr:hypothetical protein [Thiomicrospira sp.]
MNQIPQDVDSLPKKKKYPPMWLAFVTGFILAYTVGAGIGFAVLGNTGLD